MDWFPVAPRQSTIGVAIVAALVYPAVLWCGVRMSPAFVAISLAVPLLGLVAAARSDRPHARAVAHLVVAAPPLFSLLGGLLDFQHAIPVGSLGVWIALWTALAIVVATERPRAEPSAPTSTSRVAVAHGISAAVVMLFAVAHLVNHLGGLVGGDTHIAIMAALRHVYRHPVVEPILLAAVAFQIGSGLWLLRRALARPAAWPRTLQTASAVYLLVFFLSHVTAAMRARLHGTDPDWHWLDGSELLHDPWSVRLVPYYFLAVVALGVHGACGLHRVLRAHRVAVRIETVLGIVTGLATIVAAAILIGLFRA